MSKIFSTFCFWFFVIFTLAYGILFIWTESLVGAIGLLIGVMFMSTFAVFNKLETIEEKHDMEIEHGL